MMRIGSRWIAVPSVVALAVLVACGGPPQQVSSTAVPRLGDPARWVPSVANTWQWQLRGPLNITYDVDVYDIDLFDTPASTIDAIHRADGHVVCYFSAGSSEDWRPDFNRLAPSDLGQALDDWPGERWLDTRSPNVREIVRARLDLASSKDCDGVEPDNVDAYDNASGFELGRTTQLDFNRFLAVEAHRRGLAVGLKNDVGQITELATDFDFAVNEQCFEYDECSSYVAFIDAGKPVFNAEYAQPYRLNADGARDALCESATAASIRTLVLPMELDDSYRSACE